MVKEQLTYNNFSTSMRTACSQKQQSHLEVYVYVWGNPVIIGLQLKGAKNIWHSQIPDLVLVIWFGEYSGFLKDLVHYTLWAIKVDGKFP